jgi:bloom syndrome protein
VFENVQTSSFYSFFLSFFLSFFQVSALNKRNIPARTFHSALPTDQRNQLLAQLSSFSASTPAFKLLYTTPETLTSERFHEILVNLYRSGALSLIAVDEAHCISEWGHEFRKSYRRIGALREKLQSVPFLGATATATIEVRRDIVNQLKLKV